MTDTLVEVSRSLSSSDDVDHYICCDAPDGREDFEPSLCGLPATPYLGEVDQVSCVVCSDLMDNDWCPRYGTCRYGEQS